MVTRDGEVACHIFDNLPGTAARDIGLVQIDECTNPRLSGVVGSLETPVFECSASTSMP